MEDEQESTGASETERRGGIVDWKNKRSALSVLFGGAYAKKELVTAILGTTAGEDSIASVMAGLSKWDSHRPKGAPGRLFVKSLVTRLRELGSTEPNLEGVIVDGTYDEFLESIPSKRRGGLRPSSTRPAHLEMVSDDAPYHHVCISRRPAVETVASGFATGRIDHKVYYMSPESVEIWKAVIDAGQYRQYDECKASYVELVKTALWREFFLCARSDGLVMLGGGAPPKDLIAIRSVLDLAPDKRLNYALVDFSPFMLESTFHVVDAALLREQRRSRVIMSLVKWDFLDMNGIADKLRRRGQNVAWLLPGGTIGNLDEHSVFAAVANAGTPGDLFVIGAETLSPDDGSPAQNSVREKYEIPEIKHFVESPIRAAWHNLGLDGSIEAVLNRVQVRLVDGDDNGHSAVPVATSVEVFLMIAGRKVTLLTSSRYSDKHFVAFAEQYGFSLSAAIPSPLNPRYKQFVFRFGDAPVRA